MVKKWEVTHLIGLGLLCPALSCSMDSEIGSVDQSMTHGARETGYPGVVAVLALEPNGSIDSTCTGTVVGPTKVITAKHCVHDVSTAAPRPPASLRVVIGDDIRSGSAISIAVASWRATEGAFRNNRVGDGQDLAVLTTSSEMPAPAHELATARAQRDMALTIVGYGKVNDLARSGKKYSASSSITFIPPGVGIFQSGGAAEICSGDSGGPAFDESDRLLGVTSFSTERNCGVGDSYFTSVSPHLDWLHEEIGASPSCEPAAESCSGRDEDCDGSIDEGCDSEMPPADPAMPATMGALELLGATCTGNAECESGICAGTCTQLCDESTVCPMGYECRLAGEVSGCFPPEGRDRGGCSSAGAAPGSWLMGLIWMGWLRRKR